MGCSDVRWCSGVRDGIKRVLAITMIALQITPPPERVRRDAESDGTLDRRDPEREHRFLRNARGLAA
jgi:hypothetical protein